MGSLGAAGARVEKPPAGQLSVGTQQACWVWACSPRRMRRANHHFPDTLAGSLAKREGFTTEGKSFLLAESQGPSAKPRLCHNPPPALQEKNV